MNDSILLGTRKPKDGVRKASGVGRGLKVVYVPSSEVVHIENATMAESPPLPDMTRVIEANRQQFVRNWNRVLDGRRAG